MASIFQFIQLEKLFLGPGNALSLTKNDDESRKASRQNLSSGSMIYFQEDLNFDHLPPKPIQQESRLLTYLMQNYDREVRPVFNFSDTVQVKVGITLTQIFDMVSENVLPSPPFKFKNLGINMLKIQIKAACSLWGLS